MAKINIFVPGIHHQVFTGGIVVIFEHANGLVDLGHEVIIIPISPSTNPEWFKKRQFKIFQPNHKVDTLKTIAAALKKDKQSIKNSLSKVLIRISKWGPYSFQRALNLEWVRDAVPNADISIATSYETALINHLYGKGEKYYLTQHFEPFFSNERENPELAKLDALSTYKLPLKILASSSWLANKLKEEFNVNAEVCLSAIDHKIFYPDGNPSDPYKNFIVVSYGGRKAEWKGFKDAAEAIQIARQRIPHLEWKVFGESLLPPNNNIAPYTPLGFLTEETLRKAYSSSHAILCPSWYESFPLYPLEAMASGSAVITTPYGTEDYAINMRNSLVVPPHDPEKMAKAVITLYEKSDLRQKLISQGLEDAKEFNWTRSVNKLASLLGLKS
jgi:glycosyltransferase involved in cell wall biosynthesis